MKTRKFYQKLASKAAWLLTAALLLPVNVGAATTEVIDTSRTDCSITIHFEKGATDFQLYRVADINEQTKFTLAGDFAATNEDGAYKYSVELNDLDASGYTELAKTLGDYASADSLTPTATGTTDANGNYTFENLATGMYLLTGDTVTETKTESYREITTGYLPTDTIIVVPTWAEPTDGDLAYNYDPEVTVKYGTKTMSDEYLLESIKVQKQWDYSAVTDTAKAEQDQPSVVYIDILCDGAVYTNSEGTTFSNIALNAKNNWTYEVNNLLSGHEYSAVERSTSSYYTVSTSATNNVVTLTNKHNKTYDDDQLVNNDDENNENDESGSGNDSSSSSSSSDGDKLPQTGQLWWPVPVLAILGVGFLSAGRIRRSRSERKEK